MITWLIAGTLLACSLPKDDRTGSEGEVSTGPDTDSGTISDGDVDYVGELDMSWRESAIVYREAKCKLPLTLDVDADGNITGSVTCEMEEAGDTSLDFTGALAGGTITGTIEFVVSDFAWTDAWSGELADDALNGVFEGYYEAGMDAAWDYDGSFTLAL
jgi:hypothetical protein